MFLKSQPNAIIMYLLKDKAGNAMSFDPRESTPDLNLVGQIKVSFQNPAVRNILELELDSISSIDLTDDVTIAQSN